VMLKPIFSALDTVDTARCLPSTDDLTCGNCSGTKFSGLHQKQEPFDKFSDDVRFALSGIPEACRDDH